jgi:hypothetical protein
METQQQPNSSQPAPASGSAGGFLKQTEDFFYGFYKMITFHLPANVKEMIVKVGPWITLIILLFAIPVVFVALGFAGIFATYSIISGGLHGGFLLTLAGLVGLAALVCEALAIPGLMSRSLKGWYFVYYSALLSALASLFRFDIASLIIGLAVSLYILFEIKPYYK